MEQSKALSKPDFRHILADINWEHGSHLVLAAKRSDSQGLLLKSVPFHHDVKILIYCIGVTQESAMPMAKGFA
jgi:hypothetical protein